MKILAKKLLACGDEVVGMDNINDYNDINLKYGRLRELGIEQPLELDSRVKPENDGVVEFENDLKSQLLGI